MSFAVADIEAAVTRVLGRSVAIDGPIRLTPGLWSALEIRDLKLGNPSHWPEGVFLELPRFRIELGLMAVLRGQIRIRDAAVDGLRLKLVRQPTGDQLPNATVVLPQRVRVTGE